MFLMQFHLPVTRGRAATPIATGNQGRRTMGTRSLASVLGLAVAVASGAAAQQKEPGEKSLYQRIGGYDVIAAVVNDFSRRFSEDPQLPHAHRERPQLRRQAARE